MINKFKFRQNKTDKLIEESVSLHQNKVAVFIYKIREKHYDKLIGYHHIDNIDILKKGYLIKYIDISGEYIMGGLFLKYEQGYLLIKDLYSKKVTKINPENYYLFYSDNKKKISKLMKKFILENTIISK